MKTYTTFVEEEHHYEYEKPAKKNLKKKKVSKNTKDQQVSQTSVPRSLGDFYSQFMQNPAKED